MTPLVSRIFARLALRGVTAQQAEQLAGYCELLVQWNRTSNITGLPLEGFPDRTLDILVAEPIVATDLIGRDSLTCLDFGSGSGSPAIPIKVARPALQLTMVESRSRKAAFLREVVRTLGLPRASVRQGRIEDLTLDVVRVDLVTIRAVRLVAAIVSAAAVVLDSGGSLIVFGGITSPDLGDAPFSVNSVVDSPVQGRRIYSLKRR